MATLQCKLTWELSYTEQGGTYFRVSMHRLAHSEILLIKFFQVIHICFKNTATYPNIVGWNWTNLEMKYNKFKSRDKGRRTSGEKIKSWLHLLHPIWSSCDVAQASGYEMVALSDLSVHPLPQKNHLLWSKPQRDTAKDRNEHGALSTWSVEILSPKDLLFCCKRNAKFLAIMVVEQSRRENVFQKSWTTEGG